MNIHQLIATDPNVSDDFKAAMLPEVQYKIAMTVVCPFAQCRAGIGERCCGLIFPQYPHTPRLEKAMGQYRPRCGRWGRLYPTQEAADAYDLGYSEYPAVPLGAIGSPEWTGHHDAAADQDARDEMRLEQVQERDE